MMIMRRDVLHSRYEKTLEGQANFVEQYKDQSFRNNNNNGYWNTYNPCWRNHPNLSWKQNQEPNQSNQAPTQGNSLTNDISEIKKIMLDFIGEQKVVNKRYGQRLDYLEKNKKDMSQKMDNVKQTLSRLTNTLTIQERGKFPSQPQKNPRGIHEVDTIEGNYKEVKAIMILRSGRQIIRSSNYAHRTPPPFPSALRGNKKKNNYPHIL